MGEKKCKYEIPGDLSEWMTKLPPRLKAEPLNWLGIPGTHCSASYSITHESQISGEHPEFNKVTEMSDGHKFKMHKWTATQLDSILEQLEHGVRFLDLHVVSQKYWSEFRDLVLEYYCVHGQRANLLTKELEVIQSFLEKHPGEVVIIYLSYGKDFIEDIEKEKLIQHLAKFGARMCPPQNYVPSLDFMYKHGYQVILFSAIRSKVEKLYSERVWPMDRLQIVEKKTFDAAELMDFVESSFGDRDPEKFCVHYAALYPTLEFMLDHRRESLYDAQKDLADRLWSWIRNPERVGGEKGVNIIAVDYMLTAYTDLPARMIEGSYEVFLTRFALSEHEQPLERRVTEDAARPDSSKSNSSRSDSAASQNR
ncbi:unnamed protein product [Calicophoron daubneyi]|uniref:Uncharacterized protein n=1 Tax=Calicophoron daubneyi TaxID=300641 RepID=A0AAV2T742_CALDB